MIEIVSTGNDEVDRHLGGGLPLPILMLMEGKSGSGKSVLSAQFMKGFLEKGMSVMLFTDNSIKNYIEKMSVITFDFTKYFLNGQLRIVPMLAYGNFWSKEQSNYMLPVVSQFIKMQCKQYDVVVIDPLSLLFMYADTDSILNFFTSCKHVVGTGTSMILTMGQDVVSQDISLQIKSSCDANVELTTGQMGNRQFRVFNIIKFLGAIKPVSKFSFDVTTQFGIKIVPLSAAQG